MEPCVGRSVRPWPLGNDHALSQLEHRKAQGSLVQNAEFKRRGGCGERIDVYRASGVSLARFEFETVVVHGDMRLTEMSVDERNRTSMIISIMEMKKRCCQQCNQHRSSPSTCPESLHSVERFSGRSGKAVNSIAMPKNCTQANVANSARRG